MFLQIISMIRSNCYIIYKSKFKNRPKTLNHKQFTLSMINILLQKAEHYQRQNVQELSSIDTTTSSTRNTTTSRNTTRTPVTRQSIMPSYHPLLSLPSTGSLSSFDTNSCSVATRIARESHRRVKMVSNEKDNNGKPKRLNKACKYCSKLYVQRKERGELESTDTWDKIVKRTEMGCARCEVFLCADCFNLWHDEK